MGPILSNTRPRHTDFIERLIEFEGLGYGLNHVAGKREVFGFEGAEVGVVLEGPEEGSYVVEGDGLFELFQIEVLFCLGGEKERRRESDK